MRSLPEGYIIDSGKVGDTATLIEVDKAASDLFAPTGLLSAEALADHVPAEVLDAASRGANLLVIRDSNMVSIGFALVSERGGELYLDQISVHPDHGRKGLGAALVTAVFQLAEMRKFKTVVLSTFRDLPWNAPFYAGLGFKELPHRKLEPWMLQIEAEQARELDVTKRCFMRRRVRWL